MPFSGDDKAVTFRRLAQVVDAVCQAMRSQQRFNRFAIRGTDLDNRPQLFVKQRRQTIVT